MRYTSTTKKRIIMGFLDDLFKAVNTLKNVAEEFNKQTGGALGLQQSSPAQNVNNPAGCPQNQATQNPFDDDEEVQVDVRKEIEEIVAQCFPQYELRRNISPTTIGGQGRFLDYSYGLYLGGVPKLFIMIVGKKTTSHRIYRWSKEEAAKRGITMINFVEHFPNRYDYVKNRIAQYL